MNDYPPLPPEHNFSRGNSQGQQGLEKPVSVGEWVVTMLIMSIPIAGIIFMIYWAFSDTTPPSKKNYFRAALLLFAIFIALGLGFLLLMMLISVFAASQAPTTTATLLF